MKNILASASILALTVLPLSAQEAGSSAGGSGGAAGGASGGAAGGAASAGMAQQQCRCSSRGSGSSGSYCRSPVTVVAAGRSRNAG